MKLKCDYPNCKNPAFAEVDWDNRKGDWVWSNLCLPHFITEQYIYRTKKIQSWLPSYVWYSHFVHCAWYVIARFVLI